MTLVVVFFINKEYVPVVTIQAVLWIIFILKWIEYHKNFQNLKMIQ